MELELTFLQLSALAAVGVIAGWFNVIAGGGSMLTVPVMLFMGMPAPVANGTNRIGILMQDVVAVTAFRKKGFSDFRLSLSLAAMASLGAAGGALVGVQIQGEAFRWFLAFVMVVTMLLMTIQKKKSNATEHVDGKPKRLVLGHILMIAAGFWGGLIQIGVGFILMPILHKVMDLDLVRVNMHKVFIVLVYTFVALLVFMSHVQIFWVAGIALACGTMIGGWLGAHHSISFGDVWIRRVLFVTMSLFILKLLFFS